MIEWHIVMLEGSHVALEFDKKLPKGVLPPSYVNDMNNLGFLPLVGEWERTQIFEDSREAVYEKINPYFGG